MINMTDLIIRETRKLKGTVEAPPSKAYTHRAIIAASLSEGCSEIWNPLICDDTIATIEACRLLGAEIENIKEKLQIHGRSKPATPSDIINCRDSGSTMRFITPICALADGISILTGGESLRRRPMEPLLEALRQLGVRCYSTKMDGYPPIVVFGGGIKGGRASIKGDVSSQFISGLLFATPLAQNETEIILSTPLESKPYVMMTLETLREYGIKVDLRDDYRRFLVPCKQRYIPSDHHIEGDYSSAAFLLAAAVVTDSHVSVGNLMERTSQGDRIIIEVLREMNVQVATGGDYVEVQGVGDGLKALDIDLRDHPDLVPVCAVMACSAEGRTLIRGVRRLHFKESDRIDALSTELMKMGAEVKAYDDHLEVYGGRKLHGTELDSHGDHRIAMACAVAALRAEGSTVIHGIECINKSYPNFVRDIRSLGGDVSER